MDESKVAKDAGKFNIGNSENSAEKSIYSYSRISRQDAQHKVERVVQRLDLLIETLSLGKKEGLSWSGFYLVHHERYCEKHGMRPDDDSDGFRKRMFTFIAEVIAKARWEAEECYVYVAPEEASEFPPGIMEEIKDRPVCVWDGPDMLELYVAIDLIGALYEGIVGEHDTLYKISESAIFGFIVVLEDIRDRLNRLLAEMESYNRQAA